MAVGRRSHAEPDLEAVYEAASRILDECFRRDGSLFVPGAKVWTLSNLDELSEKFIGRPDTSSDAFETKLRRQLSDASGDAIQLAAEIVYLHFLIARNVSGAAKRDLIREILSWSSRSVEIPGDLADALDHGIANGGVSFSVRRPVLSDLPVKRRDRWCYDSG